MKQITEQQIQQLFQYIDSCIPTIPNINTINIIGMLQRLPDVPKEEKKESRFKKVPLNEDKKWNNAMEIAKEHDGVTIDEIDQYRPKKFKRDVVDMEKGCWIPL